MNLISCKNCGIVLDSKRLEVPDWDEIDEKYDGDWDTSEYFEWNGDSYEPLVTCPVCKNKVNVGE